MFSGVRILSAPCHSAQRWFSSDSALTVDQLVLNLKQHKYQKVLVMVGAGISTPSGVPDFRSPGCGLYSRLQQYRLPYAEAIFDLDYFLQDPKPFFSLAKELYPGTFAPSEAHALGRLLLDKGLLLRLYTQNIDGLERLAGVPDESLVEAHGTFSTASCTVCRRQYSGEYLRPAILSGSVPECLGCRGIIKPDVVFFGEQLPPHFLQSLRDFPEADLLLVLGTSLEDMFCPFCGVSLQTVEPYYGGSCGRNIQFWLSFQHDEGPETSTMVEELIQKYFTEGHSFEIVMDFLKTKHNIS